MNINIAMGVIRESVMLMLIISGILILPSFLVTLVISIFQATTQIQEQTLTFIPKLIITLCLVMFLGGFMVTKLSEHFLTILNLISSI